MAGTIITKKGIALIAKLLASGRGLQITRAAVGTGSVPQGYDPAAMIDLNGYRMDGEISGYDVDGEEAMVVFQISSLNVEEGFIITEAGLYAMDPDEGEILYAYLDLGEDPQYVYGNNSTIQKFAEIEFRTIVGSVENITVTMNPNALITREWDTSETIAKAFEETEEVFPVPQAGERLKTSFGKIRKFITDFKNWCTGVCMVG